MVARYNWYFAVGGGYHQVEVYNHIQMNSNKLFAETIKNSIDSPDMLDYFKENYHSEDNPIIVFNQTNFYKS